MLPSHVARIAGAPSVCAAMEQVVVMPSMGLLDWSGDRKGQRLQKIIIRQIANTYYFFIEYEIIFHIVLELSMSGVFQAKEFFCQLGSRPPKLSRNLLACEL